MAIIKSYRTIWDPLFVGDERRKTEIRKELERLKKGPEIRKSFRKREAARARIRNMEAVSMAVPDGFCGCHKTTAEHEATKPVSDSHYTENPVGGDYVLDSVEAMGL